MSARSTALRAVLSAILGAAICGPGTGLAADREPVDREAEPARPRVQVAILLDTSNSMDGLIDQAKRQLWSVVNQFISASRDGLRPELTVALYEYGNNNLKAADGYIRQVLPLTDDLDRVSEQLFALRTNGGSEFCGAVIQKAVQGLAWSPAKDDLKVIYIAGNEPFTQGKVDYREACRAAAARGILVNTIHCGTRQQGIDGKWDDGARLADGTYATIDQEIKVVEVAAPQDKRIAELGAKLNETYVPFGAAGAAGAERQKDVDAKQEEVSTANMAERAVSKANVHYRNDSWDLVDAVAAGKLDVAEVKTEALPANMQKMNVEQRREYVSQQAVSRGRIQAEINSLNVARQKFVAAEAQKRGDSNANSLGRAMQEAIRTQAEAKNFKF